MISRLESRLESRRAFDPSPKDELAFGRCYALLGQAKKARVWLERAAEHPETKEQAREALEGLPRR